MNRNTALIRKRTKLPTSLIEITPFLIYVVPCGLLGPERHHLHRYASRNAWNARLDLASRFLQIKVKLADALVQPLGR